ncbi:TIGR00267 family protein [Marinobacterium nitratireducens]|uniref:TIGR00267 family protein n=1 Tax=Marinobacterium nitratireducens TaxID=518897 RepID=A0A917ZN60_9GAMM|nr:VIT1/CCC1 transporter family protein [Marinobacterium nitratireducens]GGO87160.1 TIGR00267 family protein [Marinobacterium nitratireducens]
MKHVRQLAFLLRISHSSGIVRRYFIVNGFDGALTMLGIILGFAVSDPAPLQVVIGACVGATVALAVSGVSSALISESAERQRSLAELEQAMARDLGDSAHGRAARWVPWVVALANGAAPLLLALLIITPLWLAEAGLPLPASPLVLSLLVALILMFLLGVYLGRIAGVSIWRSGLRTLLVALVTAGLILMLGS